MTTIPPCTMYDVQVRVSSAFGGPTDTAGAVLTLTREVGVTDIAVLESVQPAHMVVDATPDQAGHHKWQVINPHPHAVTLDKGWCMGLATLECVEAVTPAPKADALSAAEVAQHMSHLACRLAEEEWSGKMQSYIVPPNVPNETDMGLGGRSESQIGRPRAALSGSVLPSYDNGIPSAVCVPQGPAANEASNRHRSVDCLPVGTRRVVEACSLARLASPTRRGYDKRTAQRPAPDESGARHSGGSGTRAWEPTQCEEATNLSSGGKHVHFRSVPGPTARRCTGPPTLSFSSSGPVTFPPPHALGSTTESPQHHQHVRKEKAEGKERSPLGSESHYNALETGVCALTQSLGDVVSIAPHIKAREARRGGNPVPALIRRPTRRACNSPDRFVPALALPSVGAQTANQLDMGIAHSELVSLCALMDLQARGLQQARKHLNRTGAASPSLIAVVNLGKAKTTQRVMSKKKAVPAPKGLTNTWTRSDDMDLRSSVQQLNDLLSRRHEEWKETFGASDEEAAVPGTPDHDQACADQADGAAADLTPQQRELLRRLLMTMEGQCGPKAGLTPVLKHKVTLLPDAVPRKFPPRRFDPTTEAEITAEIQRWLEEGNVEPCDGPWSAPLVVARKKGGALRLCVDYRYINSQSRKDSYPLPRVDGHLDRLGGKQYFSTIDLKWAYNHVEIEQTSREVTGFVHGNMFLQYVRMPFGLTSAPATFARLIDHVLAGVQYDYFASPTLTTSLSLQTRLPNTWCI